jgi:hypothetical protein
VEIAIVLAVFSATAVWGTRFWNAWTAQGNKPVFYQNNFEPAVMIACGYGFVATNTPPAALLDFLDVRRDALSCADIPPGTAVGQKRVFQRPWFYLVWFVGLAWTVLGISWSGMGPAFGVLFGASSALAYGLCRLAMGRALALIAVAGVATSPLHLSNMPHLRDFAKEPLTLALFFLLALLVVRPVRRAWVVGLSAAYGVVLGIAYGFRSDFLIDIPLLVITLALFLEGGLRRHLKTKAAACAAFAASFVIAGWPMLTSVYRNGGCQWHASILGLQSFFDRPLGVEPASYDFGYMYSDGYAYEQVTTFAARTSPPEPTILYCSHEYDVQSARYLRALIGTFPADFVTRAYASARTLAEGPFLQVGTPLEHWMPGVFAARMTLMSALRGAGLWLVLAAIACAAAVSLRIGLFLLTVALYVGGYPSVQFAPRHYFHLEVLVWIAAGAVAQTAIVAAWRWSSISRPALRVAGRRVGVMAICALTIVAIPLVSFRVLQTRRVRTLLSSYVTSPRTALTLSSSPNDDVVVLRSGATAPRDGDMIEVDVDRPACGSRAALTFAYDPASPEVVFTHTVDLPDVSGESGTTRVFLVVFEHFAGVQFPRSMANCVGGAYRLSAPERFDLLVDATLPPDWATEPLHQRLARWEPRWID